jgi:hypothetical protein
MKPIRLLLLLSTALAAGAAFADAYRWVDDEGHTVYSQVPPADREWTRIQGSAGRAPSGEETWKEVERIQQQLDASAEERAQAREAAQTEKEATALRRRNCEAAKANLERYQGDPGRLIREPDGSYIRLTAEQREARIEETRRQVEEYCR